MQKDTIRFKENETIPSRGPILQALDSLIQLKLPLIEYNYSGKMTSSLIRQVHAGKVKKSTIVAYSENGTRYQRNIAKRVLANIGGNHK